MATNHRENLVLKVVKKAANWVTGEWENETSGDLPRIEELRELIYDEVMQTRYIETGNGWAYEVKKDIRFMGRNRIMELIDKWLEVHEGFWKDADSIDKPENVEAIHLESDWK